LIFEQYVDEMILLLSHHHTLCIVDIQSNQRQSRNIDRYLKREFNKNAIQNTRNTRILFWRFRCFDCFDVQCVVTSFSCVEMYLFYEYNVVLGIEWLYVKDSEGWVGFTICSCQSIQ